MTLALLAIVISSAVAAVVTYFLMKKWLPREVQKERVVERVVEVQTPSAPKTFHEAFFDMVKEVAKTNQGFTDLRFEYKEPTKQVFTFKCPHCRQTNRLKSRDTGGARCGKCGLPMSTTSVGKN